MSLNGGLHETICQSCGTPVRFEINHEIEPLMKRNHALVPELDQFQSPTILLWAAFSAVLRSAWDL